MIPRCSHLFCRRPAVTSSAGRRFCVRHHPDHSRLVAEARRRLGEEYARLSVAGVVARGAKGGGS